MTPSPPSTRPSGSTGRRSSAFVRERHAPIDARGRPALLLNAGGKDHRVPASTTRANFNLYKKSKAVTEYKEFPERSHFTLEQAGWEEVADYALTWAVEHAGQRAAAA